MADSRNKKQSKNNTSRSETSSLAKKIAKARSERPVQRAAKFVRQKEMAGLGRAIRMVAEFVSAIVVATAIGFGLDALFGTRPIFMIVLLLMGFVAGVLNVVRAAAELNSATPLPDPDDLVPVDEDDD
ncbi:hypothetical protein MNBD_GAMMA03-509 [hydrothermal vent metagenome]|uniref:ATP synthase protein I n=1 Tax=hydrothermal vent metagenome TaxID=652676 RepID=A0A3B0WC32_9ZZZZ